ncbi:1,4-alpha-glucan branching protein GlgB [Salegentibacter chungangensis]|uniref:1,4-alpha-glucan branching enzyme GlgB n=2 Tax=Salegentibacter chungangensis TaxID=1335724 RepID=A0ABW3NRL8_9FLAO
MQFPKDPGQIKGFVKRSESGTGPEKRKSAPLKTAPKKAGTEAWISEYDIHLFKEGKHYHLYKKLGSHLRTKNRKKGVQFAVWAPNASKVSVIGSFNNWDKTANPMTHRYDESGIWECFIPEAEKGSVYKYLISSRDGYTAEKGDPFAFMWEEPPKTASMVWDLETKWKDKKWLNKRNKQKGKPQPVSVYELHIGSWKRVPEEGNRSLTYLELAEQLPEYIKEMGFTHVEFMPVMEHPFYGSWGYQITGYFAPSSRYGTPQDFIKLIEALHENEIGVILDWVPSHFPSDLHGLHYYDGTYLYEHADPKKGFHPDWKSYIFNYGRNEVRSFLISNAVFWLDKYHIDGLRVDAVASMLYLDYSREDGEWIPNEYGGRENLEAISFLKEFNEVAYGEFPDIITIAEESTAWPMVSRPTYLGGLGFGMKWMMGWMHDTLEYFKKDPVHRRHHQNDITFSTTYAFTENFMLPLSHDEVVYGKQALINKMPGDEWNKFANLRSLYAYMYAHPGTKLLFMGGEFGQTSEWDHDSSLEWHLCRYPLHQQIQETLKTLNHIYKSEPALYEVSFEHTGFEWIDIHDAENSVICFIRKGKKAEESLVVICNLTPVPRENYRIGIPQNRAWKELFNSDLDKFGGSNTRNNKSLIPEDIPAHGQEQSISLTLPPMAVLYLKLE